MPRHVYKKTKLPFDLNMLLEKGQALSAVRRDINSDADKQFAEEEEEEESLDLEAGVPSFQRDTISSFTSRAIARGLVQNRKLAAFDERASDSLLKACKVPVPRVYNDPLENNTLKIRKANSGSRSARVGMAPRTMQPKDCLTSKPSIRAALNPY